MLKYFASYKYLVSVISSTTTFKLNVRIITTNFVNMFHYLYRFQIKKKHGLCKLPEVNNKGIHFEPDRYYRESQTCIGYEQTNWVHC